MGTSYSTIYQFKMTDVAVPFLFRTFHYLDKTRRQRVGMYSTGRATDSERTR
jgi:hypothetical protein